jgi:acetyltransferase-like isoleucine patch superfamily enzyme
MPAAIELRIIRRIKNIWTRFWMQFAGIDPFGKTATWFATWFSPPYFGRHNLRWMNPKGFVSPSASIYHANLSLGRNIFIDDHVVIYQDQQGGPVRIAEFVSIHRNSIIQTGLGGSLTIGADTHIQHGCTLSAYISPIVIGSKVQIAENCGFYSYDHGFASGELIMKQPLQTKGGIIIEDDVWLGMGVIVLDGVRVGRGAVIGAGSVVTDDIPDEAIAVGAPARVIKFRSDLAQKNAGTR